MKKLDEDVVSYLEWCAEKYLSIRPRSEFEVVSYLRSKIRRRYSSFVEEQNEYIAPIVEKYKSSNGINDVEFVAWWIRERVDFKPRGEKLLRLELRNKGVAPDIVDDFFSSAIFDDDTQLAQLLRRKARSINMSSDSDIQKLTQYLLRKGFSYGKIKKAIEDYTESE